jgi:hypothetical protein
MVVMAVPEAVASCTACAPAGIAASASSITIDGLTRRNAFPGGCFTSAGRLRVYSGQDTVTALPSVSCLRSKLRHALLISLRPHFLSIDLPAQLVSTVTQA